MGLTLILSAGEGRLKLMFCLIREGCDLILSRIIPISQPPPLRVIIAQYLMSCLDISE